MKSFEDLLVSKDELTLEKVREIATYKFDDFDEMVYSVIGLDYTYDLQSSGELFSKDDMLGFADEDDEVYSNIDLDSDWNWYLFDGEKFHTAYKDDIERIINDVFEKLYSIVSNK